MSRSVQALILNESGDTGWSADNLKNLRPEWTNKRRLSYLPFSMSSPTLGEDAQLEIPQGYRDKFINSYDLNSSVPLTINAKCATASSATPDIPTEELSNYFLWPQYSVAGYHTADIITARPLFGLGDGGIYVVLGDYRDVTYHELMCDEVGSYVPFERKKMVEYDDNLSGTSNGNGYMAHLEDWASPEQYDKDLPDFSLLMGKFNWTAFNSRFYLNNEHNPQAGVKISFRITVKKFRQQWEYAPLINDAGAVVGRTLLSYTISEIPEENVVIDSFYEYTDSDNPLTAPNFGQVVKDTRTVELEKTRRYRRHSTLGWLGIQRDEVGEVLFQITDVTGKPFYT